MEIVRKNRLLLLVILSVCLFILFEVVGGNVVYVDGVKLMANGLCFRHLGCNNGFFGYDALTHLTGGIMEAAVLIWFFDRFPNRSLFHKNTFWKNLLILMGLLLILGYGWELIEFMYDQYRLNILHMQLLVPNRLAQPTNADTMGDIFSGLFGGIAAGFISKLFGSTVL